MKGKEDREEGKEMEWKNIVSRSKSILKVL
jgi:hypothetical protein